MPYITLAQRDALNSLDDRAPQNAGELNYVITRHAVDLMLSPPFSAAALDFFRSAIEIEVNTFLAYRAAQDGKNNYQDYNDVMGVLTCCRREMERRFFAYGMPTDVFNAVEEFAVGFYRTVVAPYEDDKIQQNGDVI